MGWLDRLRALWRGPQSGGAEPRSAPALSAPSSGRRVAGIDPRVLERVRHLHLRARQVVEGVHAGARRSRRVGQDVEFHDYRPYQPGDGLRDLDWKVLARADRLVVRRYRAEREMVGWLVLDASADLGSTPEKWEQAITLTATLAALLVREGEPVGLRIGAGEGATIPVLPPRRGREQLARIVLQLARVRPAGRAELRGLLQQVGERAPGRCMVLLVSDFMEDPAVWGPSMMALARRRADVRAFQVFDQVEASLAFEEEVLESLEEAGQRRELDPAALRPIFAEAVARHAAAVAAQIQGARGLIQRVEAREDLVPVASRFLRGAA